MDLQKGVMVNPCENLWKIGYAKRHTKMKLDNLVQLPLKSPVIRGFKGDCGGKYGANRKEY